MVVGIPEDPRNEFPLMLRDLSILDCLATIGWLPLRNFLRQKKKKQTSQPLAGGALRMGLGSGKT